MTSRSPSVRLARISDRSRLLALIEDYYRFDSIKFDRRTTGRSLDRLLRKRSLGCIWIIDAGDAHAGYAIMTYNFDLEFGGVEGIITDFFIAEDYRRRGLGARMISTIADFCRKNAIEAIELQVTRENRRARKFYEALGFETLDRTVMALNLKKPKHSRS